VHSYEFLPADPASVTGVTDYGRPVTACVGAGHVYGVQFHPQKSGPDGLALLSAFAAC
jgi:glutamine amidotransferase